MLSSHSKLIIPPETHFFHSYQNLKKEFQEADHKDLFRKKLIDFWYDHKTRIRDIGLSKEQLLKEAKRLDISDPIDLFTLQLTMYRTERGKAIIGEKTPRHMLQIPQILESFSNAKIITLFRDPRAKAYSEIKTQFGSPSVLISTNRWRNYVRAHERLENELPSHQYMMLQYLDLVSDVEGTLKKICTFLGIQFEEQMLNYYDREEIGFAEREQSWKKQTLKPLQKNKNEEWKSGLTDWQIALIEDSAGNHLEKMDYESWDRATLSRPKKLFYQSVDLCRSIWSTISGSRTEGYHDPNHFKF